MNREKILFVGAGQMALYNLNNMTPIQRSSTVVCDINPHALQKLAEKHPLPSYVGMSDIPWGDIGQALVLSNSPAHFENLELLLRNGVFRILCEKPVVIPDHLVGLGRMLDWYRAANISVGYIIQQSKAMRALHEFMAAELVEPLAMRGTWKKYRLGTRPTEGIMDDATHLLELWLSMLQSPGTFETSGKLTYLDFVDAQAQGGMHALDASYPIVPADSITVCCAHGSDGWKQHFTAQCSFTGCVQERSFEVNLAKRGSNRTEFLARVSFDDPSQKIDSIQIYRPDGAALQTVMQEQWPSGTKLGDQLQAFLTGDPNHVLVGVGRGIAVIELERQILAS